MKIYISCLSSIAALSLIDAAFSTASAQQPAAPEDQPELQEVVVTAQKREENLQKVSLAVSALMGDTLRTLGVTSAMDLTQVVPNLSVNQYGNGANVGIRGVVSLNQTALGDPASSYDLDGIYFARQRAALSGMYDVERVEVLRGPQGTLVGRNALAGGISVITNKPDLSHESASGTVGFGNYSQLSATGTYNLPISPTLGVRLALDVERHSGYINDAPNDRKFNDQDSAAGRVHILWKPLDTFSALVTFDLAHNGGVGGGGNGSGAPWGLYLSSQGASPYKYPVQPGPQYLDQTVTSETLKLNWSLPFVDITYLGNHREDNFTAADSLAILGPTATYCQTATSVIGPGGPCYHPLINYSDDRQMSHELRFSKNTDRLKSVLGLYYISEFNNTIQAYEPNNATTWRYVTNPDVLEGSKAVFSQITWSVFDRLRLTAGARETWDRKKDDGYTLLGPYGSINNLVCTACSTSAENHGQATWNKTTWHAGLDFDLTPSSMLFAAVSTGYKAGGFNTGAAPANTTYGPETLINYELGSKNQFFERRLQVNVDAFYDKYSGYQATAGTLIDGVNTLLTLNAGQARIEGVEVETIFAVTNVDLLSLNVTGLDTRFTSFYLTQGDGFSPGKSFTPYDLTGKELPYAPHATVRLGFQHTFSLGDNDALVARLDSGYTSHQWMDYHNFDVIAQGSYTRTDMSVTWNHAKFNTQLYVRNIENKAVLGGVQADSSAPGRDFNDYGKQAYFMPPRTYGVRFSGSF